MAAVKIVKLLSGMELIGKCEESVYGVELSHSFQIIVKQVTDTNIQFGIAPISVSSIESMIDVTLSWPQLISRPYDPNEALVELYQKMTGAIVIPMRPVRVN